MKYYIICNVQKTLFVRNYLRETTVDPENARLFDCKEDAVECLPFTGVWCIVKVYKF